ncbi:MAG: protein kinase [Myxococcales bacterium]|nr:protein kinase [Myxococcales bacterium]
MQRPPEALLGDRWQLLSPIGEGAMGEVWHGRHAQLGHDVAIKLMKPEAAQDQNLVARFRREARIAAQLRSKYIVRVEDYGATSDGRPYLVMEFLRGQTLASALESNARPDRSFVARAVQHIAAACDIAHSAGIVHRDLKPENCFVVKDDDGSPLVKVLDFGVAKITDNVFVTQNGALTGAHALLGTPVYMSPEQARGEPNLDGRSDLWSLGVIAYEMLTGRIPFDVGTLAQVLYAVLAGPIPAPSSLDPTLPPSLDAWTLRALSRDRAQRFATGKELAQALAQALGLARITPAELAFVGGHSSPSIEHSQSAYPSVVPSVRPPAAPQSPYASNAPLHMPSAAPAAPEALTWSGAGGGAPLVQAMPHVSSYPTPAQPVPPVVIPSAHPSVYPHPATHHGTQAFAPAINRRRMHGMGFVFLAIGALSAAALGSVVRSRRAAAHQHTPPVVAPQPLPIAPTPLAPAGAQQGAQRATPLSTTPPTTTAGARTQQRTQDTRAGERATHAAPSTQGPDGAHTQSSARSATTPANTQSDTPARPQPPSNAQPGAANDAPPASTNGSGATQRERSFDTL